MAITKIEWADRVWNPVRGCARVSEGCRNCYAERIAARFSGEGMPYEGLSQFVDAKYRGKDARWSGEVKLLNSKLEEPLKWKKPSIIFVNSMSDLFYEKIPTGFVRDMFEVMKDANWHKYLILTKRPECVLRVFNAEVGMEWRPHIWLGVSVEDKKSVGRLFTLRYDIPKPINTFVSCEPLLENVSHELKRHLHWLDWVIVGGESGPNARKMYRHWALFIWKECQEAGVPFFFKQMGGRQTKGDKQLLLTDGTYHVNEFPESFK